MPTDQEIETALRPLITVWEERAGDAARLARDRGLDVWRVLAIADRMQPSGTLLEAPEPRKLPRMRKRKPRVFKESNQWTWLHMNAVLECHGTTALPLLSLLVALAGRDHRITTLTQSLATRLCVDRRTVQLAYLRLEELGYILRSYDRHTRMVTIIIAPKAYPPPFARPVRQQPWPVPPTVDNLAQMARRRRQADLQDARLLAALTAKTGSHVKADRFIR